MSAQDAPQSLEELLDQMEEAALDEDQVTIEKMLEGIGRRSFGPLILLPGLLLLSPLSGIPTMPSMIGLMSLLFSGQLLVGREYFWLPQWMLRRKMSHDTFERTILLVRRPARFLDRWTRERLCVLTSPAGIYIAAACCAGIALTMPTMELVPFLSLSAAAALSIFGLALIARDGLLMLLAYVAFGLSGWALVSYLLG
jgi:hypothetical protein